MDEWLNCLIFSLSQVIVSERRQSRNDATYISAEITLKAECQRTNSVLKSLINQMQALRDSLQFPNPCLKTAIDGIIEMHSHLANLDLNGNDYGHDKVKFFKEIAGIIQQTCQLFKILQDNIG